MDNKMIAGLLLKLEMDDLKDADMLVEYAKEIAEAGDNSIAASIYSRAKSRLNQMTECKRMIEQVMMRAEQEASVTGESFPKGSIYKELYEDWIDSWEEKIKAKMM
ncbi:MAG: hypothetical protein J6P07_05905 [Spirochaetaceae bacterium]|nr:hypothetical protein [Spirochaetaceae bacterium]MBO7731536.1 hypothetical protein [Methanobrevibacter sp.]